MRALAPSLESSYSPRGAVGDPWLPPTVVPIVNSGADERTLTPCQGGRYLMISFRGAGGTGDVYEGVLGGTAPALVAELSDPAAQETGSFVTDDCLQAWFASTRDGTNDIFHAHRDAVSDPWILDGKVVELSTDANAESDPWVSPDSHRMFFTSDADGENDLYVSPRCARARAHSGGGAAAAITSSSRNRAILTSCGRDSRSSVSVGWW